MVEEHSNIRIINIAKSLNIRFHDDSPLLTQLNDKALVVHDDVIHEVELQLALIACLQKSQTFVDVGCQFGPYILLANEYLPDDGRIFALEASPKYAGKLRSTFAETCPARLTVENVGVAEKKGTLPLFKDSFAHQIPAKARHEGQSVPTNTLDELMLEKYKLIPDVVKIDIEGFEYQALKGSRRLISQCKTNFFVEIHHEYLRVQGIDEKMILDLFDDDLFEKRILSLAPGLPFEKVEGRRHRKTALSYWHFRPQIDSD